MTTNPLLDRTSAPRHEHVRELNRTPGLLALHATARDKFTEHDAFVRSTRRIMRLILEEALGELRHQNHDVTTPTGFQFKGTAPVENTVTAISVPRAGDAFEAELRDIRPDAKLGKILIQRDPDTKLPNLYYTKLPKSLKGKEVLLLDPMMATAGTAGLAVKVLLNEGVNESDIILVNFLTCPQALDALHASHPEVRVITSFIDDELTPECFMKPGIGDFGDRFYGSN